MPQSFVQFPYFFSKTLQVGCNTFRYICQTSDREFQLISVTVQINSCQSGGQLEISFNFNRILFPKYILHAHVIVYCVLKGRGTQVPTTLSTFTNCRAVVVVSDEARCYNGSYLVQMCLRGNRVYSHCYLPTYLPPKYSEF